MMRIYHLDAGRKFYGVPTIKGMIDTLSRSGFTHIQLYMSDNQGFRFALPDLTVKTAFGTYDLRPALGDGYSHGNSRPSGDGKYLTAADLDELIAYARSRGMDVIPGINMPGHMGTILQQFPHLRFPGSRSSLNMGNEEAVAFALELLRKHVNHFADRGCRYFLIGADEFANDLSETEPLIMGFDRIYKDGTMKMFVDFINRAIEVVCSRGMTPLAFNDGICYHDDDQTYGAVDNRVLVCYWINGWNGYSPASVRFLEEHGYGLINTDSRYYTGVGAENWQERQEKARTFNPHVFSGDTEVAHPAGAMLCTWSDRGDHDGHDDGRTVAAQLVPVMEAFGKAVAERE